ncbi:MAG: CoA pyrophosphatase [Sinimarinibacterium sp.]|jgi:8-oxo-dGTP pyrophosphatase MutT (NUDIX family)
MKQASAVSTSTDIERRLRGALASTGLQTPRPMSGLELPFKLDKLITPAILNSLRPAAVLAPVIRRGEELSMLFTVRAQHLRSHRGQISFPGGGRDDSDRDAVENALREAQEEVGLNPARVEVIGYLDDYPTLTRYLVTPVVGLIDGEPELQIDANEVAEVFEAPLSFLLDPASYERKLLSRDGLNVPFFELNWEQHRIWGATAGMLWNLAQKVARL